MWASSRLELDEELNRNDETRNDVDSEDGDFPALKHSYDRREHAHYNLSENSRNSNVLRFHIFSVAFYGKTATLWWKKFLFRREQTADVGVNAFGKFRVKNKRTHLRGKRCLHNLNMAQNNKYSACAFYFFRNPNIFSKQWIF